MVGVDREVIGSMMAKVRSRDFNALFCMEDGSGLAVARARIVRGRRVDRRIVVGAGAALFVFVFV